MAPIRRRHAGSVLDNSNEVSYTSELQKMDTIEKSRKVAFDLEEKVSYDVDEMSCWSGPTNQVSSCKNKRQKMTHGGYSGSSESNQASKEAFTCDEGHKRMVSKITDGDEEIYCWSGPPKRPRSPMKCDKPITVLQPVMRLPKRSFCNTLVKLKQQQFVEPPSHNSTSGETQSSFHQHERNKKQSSHDGSTFHSSCSTRSRNEEQHKQAEGENSETSKLACDGDNVQPENIQPVDPLLHIPIVTPPCPIKAKDSETPM